MPVNNPYLDIPVFNDFAKVLDPSIYHELPDDWWVGTSDIAGSTKAVAAGRFKDVNMVGASVICAVSNALGHSDYPFIFGGDGAGFACPPDHIDAVRDALAATATWANEALGFDLRVALIRIAEIRTTGRNVRVARYAVSPPVSYAMFSGRGMKWAEDRMKQGDNLVAPAPAGTQPNLSGLSCRWSPIKAAEDSEILSIIVLPGEDRPLFDVCAAKLFDILDSSPRKSSPIPAAGPAFKFPPSGLRLEALATRAPGGSLFKAWVQALYISLIALILFKTGKSVSGFDPVRYRDYTALNTDFRKFGDGLWMTVNCTPDQSRDIEDLLLEAEQHGDIHFGVHHQRTALMTCIVPSVTNDAHFHFLDGGEGGYTAAATACKTKMQKMADALKQARHASNISPDPA